MALKTFVPSQDFYPIDATPTQGGSSQIIVDATGEAAATIFRSPINGTIIAIKFLMATVTTGDVISGEVQSVLTTSQIPSDTLFAAGAGQSFSLTTTMVNTWQTITLATPAEVSVGDELAFVVKRADTGGAGSFRFDHFSSGEMLGEVKTGSKALAWAVSGNLTNIIPVYSGTQVQANALLLPFRPQQVALSAGAAVDEVGMIVNLPFRARAAGWYFKGSLSDASMTKVRLYNTDGTSIMASSVLNGKRIAGTHTGRFLSPTVLAADSNYRIAIFVSTGAAGVVELSLADATANGMLHMGSLCYATNRADAGAWSDNTAKRYTIGIMIDQLDDSSASGGAASGLAHIIGGP